MRIEFIYIEGKKYPLSFSLAASEKLLQDQKDLKNLSKILKDKNTPMHKKIDILCDILASLIYSGCQYYNAFNIAPYKDAPFFNEKFNPISSEQIKVVLNPDSETLEMITKKITSCMQVSNKKKINTKIPTNAKKKQKN